MWKPFLTRKPDGPQSGGTGDAPNVAPSSPTPAPSPAPASPTSASPALHVDPKTGKAWQQLYYEERSRAGRLEQQLEEVKAQFGAQVQDLTTRVGERDAAIEQLNLNVGNLTEQAARIPELETQINTLQKEAALGKKYRAAMQYPELLNVQTEQPVEGQEEPELVNPVLALIESTTLEGTELDAVLRQMAQTFPPRKSSQAPTVPPPAQPVQEQGLEYWKQQVEEAHQGMIREPEKTDEWFARYNEAIRKVSELEAASH